MSGGVAREDSKSVPGSDHGACAKSRGGRSFIGSGRRFFFCFLSGSGGRVRSGISTMRRNPTATEFARGLSMMVRTTGGVAPVDGVSRRGGCMRGSVDTATSRRVVFEGEPEAVCTIGIEAQSVIGEVALSEEGVGAWTSRCVIVPWLITPTSMRS